MRLELQLVGAFEFLLCEGVEGVEGVPCRWGRDGEKQRLQTQAQEEITRVGDALLGAKHARAADAQDMDDRSAGIAGGIHTSLD